MVEVDLKSLELNSSAVAAVDGHCRRDGHMALERVVDLLAGHMSLAEDADRSFVALLHVATVLVLDVLHTGLCASSRPRPRL
jgi:hypothetical protein